MADITYVTVVIDGVTFSAVPTFRWYVRKDGTRELQQAWRNTSTGEVLWREIGVENE